jgi:hypothetical protein
MSLPLWVGQGLEIVIGGFTGFKQRLADLIEPAPHALPKRDTEKSMTGMEASVAWRPRALCNLFLVRIVFCINWFFVPLFIS